MSRPNPDRHVVAICSDGGSRELDTWQRQPPDVACLASTKGQARDDVMKLQAIHKTSKALLETKEQRQTDPRQAMEGQGNGKH